jgi:hypothetical protein
MMLKHSAMCHNVAPAPSQKCDVRCQNGETCNVHGDTTSFCLQLCDAHSRSLISIMFLPDSLARFSLKKSPNKGRQTGNYFFYLIEVSAKESKSLQLWWLTNTTEIHFWMHLRNYGRYARYAVSSLFIFLTCKFQALFAIWRAVFRGHKRGLALTQSSWVTRRSKSCVCWACMHHGVHGLANLAPLLFLCYKAACPKSLVFIDLVFERLVLPCSYSMALADCMIIKTHA